MADATQAPATAEGPNQHTLLPDFEDAIRPAEFARLGLAGLPGAGATYTALGIGTGMLPDGGTLGVIDTGRGASAHLAEVFPHRQLRLHSFEPQALIRSLAVAADRGIDVLVVDNASPFWSGRGGALAQVDASIARRPKGDNGSRWRDVQPVLHDLTDALMTFPGHLVVTFRVAAEWAVTETEPGRAMPVRVPTKVEQSNSLEYDFGLFGTLDSAHTLTVDKSHYLAVQVGSRHEKPNEDFGRTITDWLAEAPGTPASSRDFAAAATEHWQTPDALFALLKEAESAGLLGAAVLDLGGNATTLGRLITVMGTAARVRASVNDIGTLHRISKDLDKAGRLNLLVPGMDGTPVRIGDLIKALQSTPPGSAGAQAMDAATTQDTEGNVA